QFNRRSRRRRGFPGPGGRDCCWESRTNCSPRARRAPGVSIVKRRLLFFATLAIGVMAAPPEVRIPRVEHAPELEEFVEGRAKDPGVLLTNFVQRYPGDGTPASQNTRAYLSFDDHNLYAVFVCDDAPGGPRARLSKREDIFEDDFVSFYLDTFHDGQRAYVFSVNPL